MPSAGSSAMWLCILVDSARLNCTQIWNAFKAKNLDDQQAEHGCPIASSWYQCSASVPMWAMGREAIGTTNAQDHIDMQILKLRN